MSHWRIRCRGGEISLRFSDIPDVIRSIENGYKEPEYTGDKISLDSLSDNIIFLKLYPEYPTEGGYLQAIYANQTIRTGMFSFRAEGLNVTYNPTFEYDKELSSEGEIIYKSLDENIYLKCFDFTTRGFMFSLSAKESLQKGVYSMYVSLKNEYSKTGKAEEENIRFIW